MRNVIPKLSKYWTLDTLRSFDGKAIRYGLYHKGGGPMKRVVLFANGRSEWLEKYDFLPELLQLPEDCGFLTWDHRGQGASDGVRASIDSYDTFAQDMQQLVSNAIPGLPYATVAHSMGGLVSLYATVKGLISPRVLVLSSPLLLLPAVMNRAVASAIAATMCRGYMGNLRIGVGQYEKTRFAKNPLTHSPEAYARMQEAPYKIPSPSFAWVDATFRACRVVFDPHYIKNLQVPVLVLGGSAEKVVDPKGFSMWSQLAQRISSQSVRFEMIPGARHELFNEIPKYRDRAVELTRNWLQEFLISEIS